MNDVYVWIDDRRNHPFVSAPLTIISCRSYKSAIETIQLFVAQGAVLWIDFDHDLGPGKTGYDVAKYIVENQLPTSKIRWHTHSSNPVGAANIKQLLRHYGYPEFVRHCGGLIANGEVLS